MHYLYLTVDLLSILFPLLFSFYPKANFSKKWKYVWPAIVLPATFFLIWDDLFTRMGVWGFNPDYITGIYVFNLPIEEILFFVCIPYACLFTYEAVNYFSTRNHLKGYSTYITLILIIGQAIVGFANINKWYTSVTFILSATFLLYLHIKVKPEYIGRFYRAYLFVLIPFFIVNGILTGTAIENEVVWYNDSENLGIRMGTIPIEDTFYGMLLILMNVVIFEGLQLKEQSH